LYVHAGLEAREQIRELDRLLNLDTVKYRSPS